MRAFLDFRFFGEIQYNHMNPSIIYQLISPHARQSKLPKPALKLTANAYQPPIKPHQDPMISLLKVTLRQS